MYTITYNFEQKGFQPITLQNVAEGQSLLEVALTNEIELHHNCGGVCACSTCHIYVLNGEEHLEEMSVREKHFVARSTDPKPHSRLSCQCLLISDEGVIEFVIP